MVVVDASAVLDALLSEERETALTRRLAEDEDLHAPHLVDLEILSALRRLVRARKLSAERAEDARLDFSDLRLTRYPHQELADRIWQLRDVATAYDAAYVALAEALEVPLITCDEKLLGGSHDAELEVFPA